MHKRVSPVQAAKRVLKAFLYAHLGAEVSANHVADYFRRRGYPISDVVAGSHYAISLGWCERTPMQSLKLTSAGVEAAGAHQTPVPPSNFDIWAHA